MRLGFFGGSFDPPHVGHLAVAEAAVRKFSLGRLLLAPTGRQPLKPTGTRAPFADRMEMVKLLCEGVARLEASAIDAPAEGGGANYTIDTLRRLRTETDEGDTLFAVVGADAFLDLRRWRSPDDLLAAAEWIAVSRPGVELHDFRSLRLTQEQRTRVHVLTGVQVPVSATEIRERFAEGRDTDGQLTPSVLSYIRQHHLYGA